MTKALHSMLWATVLATLCMFAVTPSCARDMIISDVTLIDGTGSAPIKHAWVQITDGRIAKISRASIRVNGAEKVDGHGKFLIPGLIDIHVHLKGGGAWGDKPAPNVELGLQELRAYLAHGITTVFDAGNSAEYIYGLRAKERAGEIISPRIFATGQVFGAAQLRGAEPGSQADWPTLAARVDKFLATGPDIQKFSFEKFGDKPGEIIPLAPLESIKKIVAYGREKGARTTIHVTEETITRTVVDAGMSTLEHPMVVEPISDDLLNRLVKNKIPFATTLSIFDDTDTMQWPRWTRERLVVAKANIKKLIEHGGIAAVGSDHFDAPITLAEIDHIGELGLPPLTVVRIATLNGALFLSQEKDIGSLEVGKWADMVLLKADPLRDLKNLRKILAVYKAGELIAHVNAGP